MNCSKEIADCLLDIIKFGLLNIRVTANGGDARRCFIEADHIHNLSELLKLNAPELLRFYLAVERPLYIEQTQEADRRIFEPIWKRLDVLAKA